MIVSCKEKEITIFSDETFLMTRELEEICTISIHGNDRFDSITFNTSFTKLLNDKKEVPSTSILILKKGDFDWVVYSLKNDFDLLELDEIVTFVEGCATEACNKNGLSCHINL